MTAVVGVTESGVRPGIGCRLRRYAVRLLVTAGLAGAGWLVCALFSTGTAAADEPPSPSAEPLGVVTTVDTTVHTTLTTVDNTASGPVMATVSTVAVRPPAAHRTRYQHHRKAVVRRGIAPTVAPKPAPRTVSDTTYHPVTRHTTATAPAPHPTAAPASVPVQFQRPMRGPAPPARQPDPASTAGHLSRLTTG